MNADFGPIALATRFQAAGVDPGWTSCAMGLIRYGLREGDEVMPPTQGQAAHHAMNNIIAAFLTEDRYRHCGSLFTLDYDHVFQTMDLETLRSTPATGYGALGALYVSRTDNRPLVLELDPGYTWDDPFFRVKPGWRHAGIQDVDLLSFGFTLWRREMLDAVGPPWCSYIHEVATEDVSLSRACRVDGWRLGVQTDWDIGHMIRVAKYAYERKLPAPM